MNVQQAAPTDIVAFVSANPVTVLLDEGKYSEFYERVKAEVTAHVPDTSTEKGRKEIASLAYKVVRSKTAIDAAGKKLNEDARKQINAVDAQRRKIRDELDTLAADVRKPLTEWEDAEKARQEALDIEFGILNSLIQNPAPSGIGSEAVADRLAKVEAETFDPATFGDRLDEIEALRARAVDVLKAALDRIRQYEADQAELARLRAEAEERERQEREAREAEERAKAEAERREREEAERKRLADEAVERARQEEQRKAEERVRAAEAEAQAIKEDAERKEREREEVEERMRREEAARAADREHRSKVYVAAKEAIMAQGAREATAQKIVLAIVAGEIPNVSIKF
jgi:colicin import membrane protein